MTNIGRYFATMSHVKAERINHWLLIRFTTERLTDPITVNDTQAELESVVKTLPLRCQVAVNFAGVEYVSSQVIGMLLGLRDQIASKGGTLVLCKLSRHVLDVMRVTRLDRHFTFSDSVSKVVGPRPATTRSDRGHDVDWRD